MEGMKLSVILAAYNEESMIESCLKLLGFADEIVVVVDSRSDDRTERIAKKYTKRVFRRKLESFATQKNYGIGKATGDWIMVVDADERITPALAAEVESVLADPGDRVAFKIPIRNFFFARAMKFGGWQEQHIRLIKKSQARYSGDIHETLSPRGPVGELREPIWHFSHRNIQNMMGKTVNYGEVQAEEMLRAGHPKVTVSSFFKVIAKELNFRLIKKRGHKDGVQGTIESVYQAFSLFVVYVILWQKQQKPSLEKKYQQLEEQARKHT
jgi:glycosyltransferase involved in cell wall biosynthesis